MTVIPTCVLSATQFYGQLGKYFNAVEYAQRRLNNWRSRYEYELHTQIPGIYFSRYFNMKYFLRLQTAIE